MIADDKISVVLVDENDHPIGTMDKLEAHVKGALHRAFSVIIYNQYGQILLQRRAESKYHCPGLWANTCCGHPFPEELSKDAAVRRLQEEMGFTCPVHPVTSFIYKLDLPNNLIEHEFVHIFSGVVDEIDIMAHPDEVSEFTWLTPEDIRQDIKHHADRYAPWFVHYINERFDEVFPHFQDLSTVA